MNAWEQLKRHNADLDEEMAGITPRTGRKPTEFNKVRDKARALGLNCSRYNPGDGTRYRVAMLDGNPHQDYFSDHGNAFLTTMYLQEMKAFVDGWAESKRFYGN